MSHDKSTQSKFRSFPSLRELSWYPFSVDLCPLILCPILWYATIDFCHCRFVLPVIQFHINAITEYTLFNLLFYFFKNFIYLFIYLWLCWVFVSVWGLSPVAASGGHSSTRCAGLSPPRPLPLRSTGSRRAGSAIVAHRPSRFAACGIFPDQGSNPCPLHWQADSQPLRHWGSPNLLLLVRFLIHPC